MAADARRFLLSAVVGLATTAISLPASAQRAPVPLIEMSHTAWSYADSVMLGGATRVLVSSDGYVWLASTRGLVRFDGVRFTLIDSTDTPVLRSRRAGMFTPRLADRRGTLWISRPDGGLVAYEDGRFRLIADSLDVPREMEIATDSTGRVFLWARFGRWLVEVDDAGRIDSVPLPPVGSRTIAGITGDLDGGLWLGTQDASLWQRTPRGWIEHRLPVTGEYGPIIPLRHTRDGTLWVTHRGTLYQLAGDRWTKLFAPGKPGVTIQARQVVEDANGSTWIAATSGLLRWHDGVLEKFDVADGLSGGVVTSVHVNDAGVAWIATGAGLDRLRAAPLITVPDVGQVRMESVTRIVRDATGIAWAEIDGGRYHARLDGRAGVDSVHLPGTPENAYQLLEPARAGGAWLAPVTGGLGKLTRAGFERVGDEAGLPRQRLWRMHEATDGSIWLATLFTGVGRLHRGRYQPVALPGVTEPAVSSFAEDSRGHVWISLDREPAVVAMDGDRVVRRLDAASGVRDTVLRLVAERGDTLWGIGTRALVRITGDRAVTLESPGLPGLRGVSGRRVSGTPALGAFIAGDRLWIAGEGGIGHFALAELHAAADGRGKLPNPRMLDAHDGIDVPAARSLTLDPVSPAGDGRFWIRTPTGFATFDPRRVVSDVHPARPIIEEVMVGGRRVPLDRPLEIGPNPERVEIRVTATAAGFPERVRLEHRLDGAEARWSGTDASRTVTYTQLRPGAYTFRLRTPDVGDGASTPDATLAFRVLPAWYQAWWFAGLAILVLAAGGPLAVYVWLRHRSRQRELQLQTRFDAALAERTRVARELHDTLLQGFTGITLQLQGVLRTVERSPEQAAERLSRTLTLADATLLDARRMIWDMRVPELEHNDLASALEEAAKQAVTDTPITVRFQVRGRSRRLTPLVESTALRVGREATTNAVRHANPSAIDIDLVYGDTHIDLSVRDDGRGLETDGTSVSAHPGHWGLSGMRERAAHVGGAFDIRGTPGAGTLVTLRLPIEVIGATNGSTPGTR